MAWCCSVPVLLGLVAAVVRLPVALSALRAGPWPEVLGNGSYVAKAVIVSEFPHEASAFTQGLCFDGRGRLYESDGLYHRSAVRRVTPSTGKSEARADNDRKDFGEGITVVGDRLWQLTWQERRLHEFDLDLTRLRTIPVPKNMHEGWGLAYDEAAGVIYGTDGSHRLFTFDPSDWSERRAAIDVFDDRLNGLKINGLNELEMVEGELWANVLPLHYHRASPCVARIDVATGAVRGWVDLTGLWDRQSDRVKRQRLNYVTNGLAYKRNAFGRPTLYATGKQWDFMYDIDVAATDLGAQHVAQHCDLYFPPKGRDHAGRPAHFP